MTYIPPKEKKEFEQVKIDEFINGEIVEVQEKKDVEKVYTNDEGEKESRLTNQTRFKFKLEGYEHNHYSRWMNCSMNEKSNLFKFLQMLYVDRIVPDIGVNLDPLKGLKVKVMWDEVPMKQGGMFQFPCKIRALSELPIIWDVPEKETTPF